MVALFEMNINIHKPEYVLNHQVFVKSFCFCVNSKFFSAHFTKHCVVVVLVVQALMANLGVF